MAQATKTISVRVNGEDRAVPSGTTVATLIEDLGIGRTACAVEVNRDLVPKAGHGERALSEGDSVEIVTLVGGG